MRAKMRHADKRKKNQCELARKLVLFSFIYTANAATTRNERSGSESVGMTHLREWQYHARFEICDANFSFTRHLVEHAIFEISKADFSFTRHSPHKLK
jgi:hypothetical protein